MKGRPITHGMSYTRTYRSWKMMWSRVRGSSDERHTRDWSERGITVCDRWAKFENFLADMGERPEGKTLDRIKNELGYSLENCRWATSAEQQRNTRRTRMLTYRGVTLCKKDWAKRIGISSPALSARLNRMTVEEALSHEKYKRQEA